MGCFGFFWVVVGLFLARFSLLWVVLDRFGSFWLVLGLFVAHFGLCWVVLACFRSPFGSFSVVAETIILFRLSSFAKNGLSGIKQKK